MSSRQVSHIAGHTSSIKPEAVPNAPSAPPICAVAIGVEQQGYMKMLVHHDICNGELYYRLGIEGDCLEHVWMGIPTTCRLGRNSSSRL